jgi:hypothetical protein
MTARRAAASATAAVTAILLVVLLSTGDADAPRLSTPPRPDVAAARVDHPRGVVVDCSRRSEANFPGAFGDPSNLVAGPLVLVGGTYTPASVVREYGGNKFPLLVKAGHRVTLRLPAGARRAAGLAYGGLGDGPLPQGEQLRPSDGAHTMTFVACKPGKPSESYSPDGPSASYAGVAQVTFWSGFVLTRAPRCLPLEVYVDDEPSPRRTGIALGRPCPG